MGETLSNERLIQLIRDAGKLRDFRRYMGRTPQAYFAPLRYSPDLAICVLTTFGIAIPADIQNEYAQHLA